MPDEIDDDLDKESKRIMMEFAKALSAFYYEWSREVTRDRERDMDIPYYVINWLKGVKDDSDNWLEEFEERSE